MKAVYIGLSLAMLTVAFPQSSDAQLLKHLVSKPSISPADSAAAIKNFMTGTGGGGLLYQFQVVYNFTNKKNGSVIRDTMTLAITDGHNVRSDMGMPGYKMEVLGHAGMPRYSVIVHPDSKTYVFNIIDTGAINSGGITYQVTKVGNETVQGYNCIHSRLTTITSQQKLGSTNDIWTSTDVPGYTALKKLTRIQGVTPKMSQALEEAGCGGFIVKMSMQSKELLMEMLLIGADRKTFPDAMFRIPAGYTQR